jgi:hypothetical protein
LIEEHEDEADEIDLLYRQTFLTEEAVNELDNALAEMQ